jgi:dTDP-6-deoxy-L-talose 4-dehydrogenase (NAD+)
MKWVRVFYTYGEGQSKKTLYGQMEDAIANNAEQFNMSQGEQLRDYILVDCAAEYIVKIALQNDITGIINCCSGKPVSVRKFVEDLFREKGVNMKLNLGYYPYPQFEPLGYWGDTKKLNSILMKYTTPQ